MSSPRYGHGRPPHARLRSLFAQHREATDVAVASILECTEPLSRIPLDASPGDPEPRWHNGFLPALDCAALYAFCAKRPLSHYVEIGSGQSTKFVARARRDGGRDFKITSIDPQPRVEVDSLCDDATRLPLELADLSVFDELGRGDVVFCDCSHYAGPSSDVTVFWLDVLPRLADGVLVGLHDILLPDDYSEQMIADSYNEQYMLATALLAGGTRLRPVLAAWDFSTSAEGRASLEPLWSRLGEVERFGSSFWFEINGT